MNPSTDEARPDEARTSRADLFKRLIALFLALLMTVPAILLRDRIVGYEKYGYVGLFLINLLGSGSIIVPIPALLAVYFGGSVWNPMLVGLSSGLGSALGELSGYLAGYSGQGLMENRALYLRFEGWMRRNGFLTVFLLALIPNPLFDLAGIAAGVLRFPLYLFLTAAFLGKILKMIAVAYAGAYSLVYVRELIQRL
jgi:uncharacterized membrane protein YdjX (TVP38/TMEM64 family)